VKSADLDQLPEGWAWVELIDLIQGSLNGYGKRKQDAGEPTIVLRLADILGQEVSLANPRRVNSTVGEVEKYRLKPGDLLTIRVNGSPDLVGRLIHFLGAKEPVLFCDHFIRVRLVPGVIAKLVRLYGDSPAFRWHVETTKVSSAGQNTISQEALARARIPLPPLSEQLRIVAKVEALLARVNAARQRLARGPMILKRFRQSVLTAACSGRLTADWRNENSVELAVLPSDSTNRTLPPVGEDEILFETPPSWQWCRLGSVAAFINGDRGKNYPNKREYVPNGIPFINTGHIQPDGSLSSESMHYLTRDKFDSLRDGKIRTGDLIYCLRGATLGKTAFVAPYVEGAIASSLVIIRLRAHLTEKFVYHVLTSPYGKELVDRFDNGSAQPNLSANSVKHYVVPLPPLAEQHEIVRRVEALFRLADAIEKRVAAATARAEKLTQAILAKAFRGELVPTEAELARREGRSYEPGSLLLERIRAERASPGIAKTRKPQRTRAEGR
jgi:type I restriction enzyme S subunit